MGLPTIYADALEQAIEELLLGRAAGLLAEETVELGAQNAQERLLEQMLDSIAERALEASGALLRALERRAEQIEAQLSALRAQERALRSRWEKLSTEEKQQIFGSMIEVVHVEAQTITLVWRF